MSTSCTVQSNAHPSAVPPMAERSTCRGRQSSMMAVLSGVMENCEGSSVSWREKEWKKKRTNVVRVSRVCCPCSLRFYRRDKLVVLIVDLPLSMSVAGKLLRSFM